MEHEPSKEKKKWWSKLKEAADKSIREGASKTREAIDAAKKAYRWAEDHGIDLKDVYENASNGTVLVPESVINEYLAKSVDELEVKAIASKCHDGHVEVLVTKKKLVGTYAAICNMKFTKSAIDKKNHVIELELLCDIQPEGVTLISKVVLATTAFILKALYGRRLVEPDSLGSEIITVDGKILQVDLDKIEKLRPALTGKVKGISLFDLLVVKQIREVTKALEVSVELGPLGRLAATVIAAGRDYLEK